MMSTSKIKGTTAFTLIESLVATLLVGIAVAALLISTVSYTRANGFGIELSTAEFLIEEIKERTAELAVIDPQTKDVTFGAEEGENWHTDYDDLDDYDNVTFSPPIDMAGNTLDEFQGFSQKITVQNVDPANLANTVSNHASSLVRVTVTITRENEQISSSSWIRARF